MATRRIFLISPAHSGGKRAAMLVRFGARFELAEQVKIGAATIGDVFSFCSGLYFRGKLKYAHHFAASPTDFYVITSTRGLVSPDELIGTRDLAEFASTTIDSKESLYTEPLERSAEKLLQSRGEVVLLGSIATGKYIDTLLPIFGERLVFPIAFLGRGDMSRGSLLLRAVAANQELKYRPVAEMTRLPPSASRAEVRNYTSSHD